MKFKKSCLVTLMSLMMAGCSQDPLKNFENTEMSYIDKDKVVEEYRDNSTASNSSGSSFLPFWLGWMALRSMGGGGQALGAGAATVARPPAVEKHVSNIQKTKANIAARGSSAMRGSVGS